MKVLFPPTAACLIVALIATVSYAESEASATSLTTAEASVADAEPADEKDNKAKKKLVELSVAPESLPLYPDDRPAWISEPPGMDGSEYVWVVQTSQESVDKCEVAIEVLKRATVRLYVQDLTGWACDDDVLPADWVNDTLVAKSYLGTLTQGDRELHEIATELRFDSEARERIRSAHKNSVVKERLAASGGLFAFALIGLVCSGGLLSVVSRRYS